jgi:hypothetical protein
MVLIRPVMTWDREYAADAHLLKRERLQNRVFRVAGKLDRCIQDREMRVGFKIPFVNGNIIKATHR